MLQSILLKLPANTIININYIKHYSQVQMAHEISVTKGLETFLNYRQTNILRKISKHNIFSDLAEFLKSNIISFSSIFFNRTLTHLPYIILLPQKLLGNMNS